MELHIEPTNTTSRDISLILRPQSKIEQALLNALHDRFSIQFSNEDDVVISIDNVLTVFLREQERND